MMGSAWSTCSFRLPRPARSADVPFPGDHVLDGGEFLEGQRAPGVQLLRGDADLGPQAEHAAVGEAGGRVDVDDGGIDGAREAAGGIQVAGDDGLRVPGAVAGDVLHGLVQARDTTLTAICRSRNSVA